MNEFEKAKKRYNDLMFTLCYEHLTIGTSFSEGTDHYKIKDMVDECEYALENYYDDGHVNGELKFDHYKTWRSETGKLKRFIAKYKAIAEAEKAVEKKEVQEE